MRSRLPSELSIKHSAVAEERIMQIGEDGADMMFT
jgi:hypothetical protein